MILKLFSLTISHNTSVQTLVIRVHVVDDVGVGISPPGALKQKFIEWSACILQLTFYIINYLETILAGLVSP